VAWPRRAAPAGPRCVDALSAALGKRLVPLPLPKATCDTVLCFCGIRLHQIGWLCCPAVFAVGAGAAAKNATPTAGGERSGEELPQCLLRRQLPMRTVPANGKTFFLLAFSPKLMRAHLRSA